MKSFSSSSSTSASSSISCVSSDVDSIVLLLFLYTIQGIPMGLGGSIPFLLQGKVSYAEQGFFSLVTLPFSLKLIWAPIVDAVYWKSFGRRRSWLVPVQFVCGFLMLWGSNDAQIGKWMGDELTKPSVQNLTIFFSCLYVLMATQDIAVDGWALTMLSKTNRGYASTCNTIGQTVGFFIAHVGFLALNDPTTCNRLFRSSPINEGMVSLGGFLHFWGWVIIAMTLFVLLFKQEERSRLPNTSSVIVAPLENRNTIPHCEASVSLAPLCCEELHFFADTLLPPNTTCTSITSTSTTTTTSTEASSSSLQSSSRETTTAMKLQRVNVEKGGNDEIRTSGDDIGCMSGGGDADVDGRNIIDFQVEEEEPSGVLETYKLLWKILWLKPVQLLVIILMTCRIPFAATDSSTHLKIIEYGMSKEELAFFAPLLIPFGILSPMLIGKYIVGPHPLRSFIWGVPLRMFMCIVWAAMLPLTSFVYSNLEGKSVPLWFYVVVYIVTSLYNVCTDMMFVSLMAFFAKVSDPRIGGTYMTFLNTITNLGSKWPQSLSLWLMDFLTFRSCTETEEGLDSCRVVDGYYIQAAMCLMIGIAWMLWFGRSITTLELMKDEEWQINYNSKTLDGKQNNEEKEMTNLK